MLFRSDLREGKPTMPLLLAMARGNEAQRARVRQAIEAGEVERLAEIVQIVRTTGAIEATRAAAQAEAELALQNLSRLPDGPSRAALQELALRSVSRSS